MNLSGVGLEVTLGLSALKGFQCLELWFVPWNCKPHLRSGWRGKVLLEEPRTVAEGAALVTRQSPKTQEQSHSKTLRLSILISAL